MKDTDYTLELSDGTIVQVGAANESRHPDIRAFHFPPGSLIPFSHQNLPTARREHDGSETEYAASGASA
jgi:hypothetical protein